MSENKKEMTRSRPIVVVLQICLPGDVQQTLAEFCQGLNAGNDLAEESSPAPAVEKPVEHDPWLQHSEAAGYLGMSPSTLYKKACDGEVEYRKLCGRNEYRRSELDRYAEKKIRPARRSRSDQRIIPLALSSGK